MLVPLESSSTVLTACYDKQQVYPHSNLRRLGGGSDSDRDGVVFDSDSDT